MPGGLLRSEYRGAVYDLRRWLIEVAQLSKPRQDCRAFLLTFLLARRAWICSASFASFSGSRLTVSERKLNFQPHQIKESPRAAFFQEIGLLILKAHEKDH